MLFHFNRQRQPVLNIRTCLILLIAIFVCMAVPMVRSQFVGLHKTECSYRRVGDVETILWHIPDRNCSQPYDSIHAGLLGGLGYPKTCFSDSQCHLVDVDNHFLNVIWFGIALPFAIAIMLMCLILFIGIQIAVWRQYS